MRDPVQYKLMDEVKEIETVIEQLDTTRAAGDADLKALIRAELALEVRLTRPLPSRA